MSCQNEKERKDDLHHQTKHEWTDQNLNSKINSTEHWNDAIRADKTDITQWNL